MGRLIVFLIVVFALYVAWDRGMFGTHPHEYSTASNGSLPPAGSREGPAERVGAVIDRGIAKAGRAIEDAGRNIQHSADGRPIDPYRKDKAPSLETSRGRLQDEAP